MKNAWIPAYCRILLLLWILFGAMAARPLQAAAGSACIDTLRYIPLDPAVAGANPDGLAILGAYERISPDGRFILRSRSGGRLGQVTLIELPVSATDAVRIHETPLSDEAFPVQGSWRYLVDINGAHYRFADVLSQGKRAPALFKAGMTGFYAAAAELSDAEGQYPQTATAQTPIRIRSLSWPQQNHAEIQQGVGPLQMTQVYIHDDGAQAHVVRDEGARFICSNRQSEDGHAFALPMISVDGLSFSAIPQSPHAGQPSMRVYSLPARQGVDAKTCRLLTNLGESPSKAVFGFASPGQAAWLTYSDMGHVYFFVPELERSFALGHGKDRVLASAFPGMTRDGRIVFGASWRTCAEPQCPRQVGYVVADPYQSRSWRQYWQQKGQLPPKACITEAETAAERVKFSAFHGLP